MNTVGSSRACLRKNSAQDRLNRLREELKMKRKIQEKFEKLGLKSPSKSFSVGVIVNKFLPDANQVDFRNCKRAAEAKPLTGRNLDKPEVVHKRNQPSKSLRERSYGAARPLAEDSKTADRRRKPRRNSHPPSHAECSVPDNVQNRCNERKIELPDQSSYKKSRRGIGPERIERARKSPSKATPCTKVSVRQISQNADLQPFRPSSQTRLQKLTAEESAFTFSKLSSDIPQPFETHSISKECAAASSKPSSSSHSQIEANLQQPAAALTTFSFSNLGPSVIASADSYSSEYDMDVDMDVDVDVEDSFSSANVSADSSTRISQKWSVEEQEKVLSNVHKIECIREESAYLARHDDYISDVDMNLSVPSGDFLIVVDTNIFLSHLRFLHRLLKSSVSNYRTHILVVPWVVIQEIDYAMKKKDQQLASQAKLANYFIFECLKKQNSKFFGQSFEDFKVNFKNTVSIDDFLLQYCLKLISMRNNVVLLSDDKNLCSKCMFSNVGAYTKDEFEKTFDISPLQKP